jgi:outer membrane protein assembly factor BamA
LNYKKTHVSFGAAEKEVQAVIATLRQTGFLLAQTDSLIKDQTTLHAYVTVGQKYRYATIRAGNLEPSIASRIGISERLFTQKPFNYQLLAKSIEKILSYYENNGYPFARVSLDSVVVKDAHISAQFKVQKNKLYKIDSVLVVGTAKLNPAYLRRYLSVKEGMLYNEQILSSISSKIRQLPFLSEKQTQRVQLSNRTNKLILYLDKKNASQFDGIIGLLPDATTKKTIVTGDVKLKLVNGVLRNGETFDLEWRRLQTQTQDFNGRVIYPFLFKSPLGVDYNLKIYRKDSTFTDITNNIGLQYYFGGLNHFKVFYRHRSTNLISTAGLDQATTLPEYADIGTSAYGMGLFLEKLDYRFNPRKGLVVTVNVQTGDRSIRKNPAINDQAYVGLSLRSTQYQFDWSSAWYLHISGNNVLKFGVQAASVFGDQTIYRNELFRIGGLKTLRGFDEESIYASSYVIPTIEYRFLFGQNSNLLLFAEGAWYENSSNHQYLSDTPISLGAGINFDTKAGIFSLNYGLGNQFGNGFDLRNGKIHFGLTALF